MKNIPDNVVFNKSDLEYDAFKMPYPTDLTSPNFEKPTIRKISHTAITNLKTQFKEINDKYQELLSSITSNELVYNARCNFKTIIGSTYYLYSKEDYNFLSIIKPSEWDQKFVGSYTLMSNDLWVKN
tara:strand:+ start:1016 stop:1396 length:381 start_codon:yes stop_codon:yes gene_type:complete